MARPRSYIVSLTEKERKCIRHLRRKTKSNNAKARYDILLEADESRRNNRLTYGEISARTGTCVNTVISTLRDFCEGGLKAALTPQRNPKVTNHQLSWWFDYAPPGQVPGPPKGGSLFHSLLAASYSKRII